MQHAAADLGRLLVEASFRHMFSKRFEDFCQHRPGSFLEVDIYGVRRLPTVNDPTFLLIRVAEEDIETVDDLVKCVKIQELLLEVRSIQ